MTGDVELARAQHYADMIYDGPVGGFPVGTPATREVLDALPIGSFVATYSNPWMKGDVDRWASILAEHSLEGVKWRDTDWFERVAAFVVYDATDAYARRGRFSHEVYNRYEAAVGRAPVERETPRKSTKR